MISMLTAAWTMTSPFLGLVPRGEPVCATTDVATHGLHTTATGQLHQGLEASPPPFLAGCREPPVRHAPAARIGRSTPSSATPRARSKRSSDERLSRRHSL